MTDIRIIGLDLDDTALNTKKQLTPRTQRAIARAIRAGIAVLPATGRSRYGLPDAFMEIPGVRYAVTSNGAKVYDLEADEVLLSDCFSTPAALEILDACEGLGVKTASVFMGGTAYTEKLDLIALRGIYPPQVLKHLTDTRKTVPSLRRIILGNELPVEKYSIVFEDLDRRQRLMDILNARGDCSVTSSIGNNLEVNTRTANKGRALLALASRLGIPAVQVMAVGDSLNDLEMLRMVGYSVAMGNAAPEVKAAASAETRGCDEDGAALAIEAILQA